MTRCALVQSLGEGVRGKKYFWAYICVQVDFVHLSIRGNEGVHAEGQVCARLPGTTSVAKERLDTDVIVCNKSLCGAQNMTETFVAGHIKTRRGCPV